MNLKQITQSGIATFNVPASWSVEIGDEGGGCFWDPSGQLGTLRLDIITFDRQGDLSAESLLSVFDSTKSSHPDAVIDSIDPMNALLEYETTSMEDGEMIRHVFWERLRGVKPRSYYLAIFSYSDVAERFESAKYRESVEIFRQEVRNCAFDH